MLKMNRVLYFLTKMVNFIRAEELNYTQFVALLEEHEVNMVTWATMQLSGGSALAKCWKSMGPESRTLKVLWEEKQGRSDTE